MTESAVTLDFWYTLVYLSPSEQDRYLDRQLEIAVESLGSAERAEGGHRESRESIRSAFLEEMSQATAAATAGQSIPIAAQYERAAQSSGRVSSPADYLSRLGELITVTPFRMTPYAAPTLKALKRAGYRLGLVSNTVGELGQFLRPVLDGFGILEFFDALSFSDELPWTKPNPEIFLHTMRALRSRPETTVHVGDAWSDVEGARRARLRAGLLFTGHPPYSRRYRHFAVGAAGETPTSQYTLSTLRELPRRVGELIPAV